MEAQTTITQPDLNEPAYWREQIEAEEARLQEAEAREIEADRAYQDRYHQAGIWDEDLRAARDHARTHVGDVEKAVERKKAALAAAEDYQLGQVKQGISREARQRIEVFLKHTQEVQDCASRLAAAYERAWASGHSIGVCIGKSRKLLLERGLPVPVYAGDAREGLSVAGHYADRVAIEIMRQVGPRLWPKFHGVPIERMRSSLLDAHQFLADNALGEIEAYLNAGGKA